jgi:hypothetical protein
LGQVFGGSGLGSQKAAESVRGLLEREEQRLRRELEVTRARIKGEQVNLRRLGLSTMSDAFETWDNLVDKQGKQFKRGLIFTGVSVGLSAVSSASRPIGSFTPPQANALIARLREKRITDPFLEDGIRKIAMTSGKPR